MPPCGTEPGADPAPPAHPAAAALDGGVVPSTLWMSVSAAPTAAWPVRERFAAWLTALRWPALVVEDVVFAISEAVSNSSEHAYPPGTPDPVIEITAVIEHTPVGAELQPGQRVRVRVRDHGTWRPIPPDPSHRGRGRGLQMMIALMNDVVIHHGDTGPPGGTEVTLVSPTVVPQPGGGPSTDEVVAADSPG